jgi:hypothetical protein
MPAPQFLVLLGPAGFRGPSGLTDENVALSGDITPPQITADQDNYNPTGLATASTLRLATDASRLLNGVAGGADGRLLILHNVGAFDLVLADEAGTSTAANRFALPANVTMTPDTVVLLQYDSTSQRWRVIGGGGGGGGAALDLYAENPTLGFVSPVASGTNSVAIGESASDGGATEAVVFGSRAVVSGAAGVALGPDTSAAGTGIAAGSSAVAGANSVAVGASASAAVAGTVAVGLGATAGAVTTTAIGAGAAAPLRTPSRSVRRAR